MARRPSLGKAQREHFARMTAAAERRAAIADAERQIGYIACSATRAADEKREELQARIDYLRSMVEEGD